MRLVQVVTGPLLVATGVALGWYAWRLRGSLDRPGGTGLVGVVVLQSLVSLAEGVVVMLGLSAGLYDPLTQVAVFGGSVCWMVFVVAYTGRWTGNRAIVVLLSVVPAAGTVGAVLRILRVLPLETTVSESSTGYLLLFGVAMVGSLGLLVGHSVLLVWDATRYASFEWRRGVALSLVGVAIAAGPLTTSLLEAAAIISVPTGAVLAQGLTLGTVALGVEVGRPYRSLPVAEAIGRDAIVSNLRDSVVVVDGDARIVDMNESAERLFDRSLDEVVREPLSVLLDADALGPSGLPTESTTVIDGPGGNRHYDVSLSSVTRGDRPGTGYAVALRDVTDERIRRQRLEVLHRVLRHNVRNDVTAVYGMADAVEAAGEDDIAERLRETAASLSAVSEQARTVEKSMRADPVGEEPTDVAAIARRVADEARADGRSVSVTADGACEVDRAREVVATVCEQLVSSALDATDGPVRLTVERDDDAVVFAVEAAERFVETQDVRAVEAGRETQLEHAEQLDVWAASWGADHLGGELSVDRSDGARVAVRIPVE